MAQEPRTENGVAPDVQVAQKARKAVKTYPQLEGYGLLALGIVLLLFSLGYFPLLKWLIGIAGVGLILFGTVRSNIVSTISTFIEKLRNRYS